MLQLTSMDCFRLCAFFLYVFDGGKDAYPIPNATDTHLFECSLIDVKKDSTSDIIASKRRRVVAEAERL